MTITGTNLLDATVYFGPTPGTNASDTAGTIVVKSPPNSVAGSVDVTVVTPSGATAPSALYQFTYLASPHAPAVVNRGAVVPDVNDLALLALAGQSSPSGTIQRRTDQALVESLLL